MGYLIWEHWLGTLGLGSGVWDVWFGTVCLGSLSWDPWFGILGSGLLVRYIWFGNVGRETLMRETGWNPGGPGTGPFRRRVSTLKGRKLHLVREQVLMLIIRSVFMVRELKADEEYAAVIVET